jgi:hypothetical protein
MTIYCKDCNELEEKKKIIGLSSCMYCKKYNTYLRMVPMDDAIIKYPIKCLECIENQEEKSINK